MAENSKVKVGELVPDVTVSDERGEQVALRAIEGGYVLYFYPKDMTPGCTSESCDFQASLGKFEDLGYAVYGISPEIFARLAAGGSMTQAEIDALLGGQPLEAAPGVTTATTSAKKKSMKVSKKKNKGCC